MQATAALWGWLRNAFWAAFFVFESGYPILSSIVAVFTLIAAWSSGDASFAHIGSRAQKNVDATGNFTYFNAANLSKLGYHLDIPILESFSTPGHRLRGAIIFISCLGIFLASYFVLQRLSVSAVKPAGGKVKGSGPLLLPCRVTHSRSFPKKHSFSYSYLQVAVPIGWKGTIGSFLSVEPGLQPKSTQSKRTWFEVNADDYLARGNPKVGLSEKLRAYLASQDDDLENYTSAWLVTAPRFLNYNFNPISFWYLYCGDVLQTMVFEVNNTFDERRMYYLTQADGEAASASQPDDNEKSRVFKPTWPKDFHVSPFNSRKGTYSATVKWLSLDSSQPIDNIINLRSSKDHHKLIARICSTGPAVNPQALTGWDQAKFMLSWWWVGFFTFPRILKEAAKLFFRRKLHVWYRPEPMSSTIGRNETHLEKTIERSFREYLRALGQKSSEAFVYIASGNTSPQSEFFGTVEQSKEPATFQVLTPAFYRDVASAQDLSSFVRSGESVAGFQRLFICSSSSDFAHLFSQTSCDAPKPKGWRWRFIQALRKGQLNSLDSFVASDMSEDEQHEYYRAVTKCLLSDRLALGVPELLGAEIAILDAVLAYASVRCLLFVLG